MTAIEHPRCHSCGSRNPLSDFKQWIPAFAGMTARAASKAPLFLDKWIPAFAGMTARGRRRTPRCHSCGSRNPLSSKQWIPAFAGMTARAAVKRPAVIPSIQTMDSRVRGNDSKGTNGFPRSRE
ncbi:hypothetical protein QUF72_04305 [Desulfobacterales bacterium HSG2]|nr:hypothetical protein [Desulfobacterales bacterium HSG2]